jgi:hypothetical protein
VSEQARLDAITLVAVEMPNKDGFIELGVFEPDAESGVRKK